MYIFRVVCCVFVVVARAAFWVRVLRVSVCVM